LLIDEADTFLSESDELRGILNSGHRQGGAVIRAVGENLEPRSFSTYSACAIALIGKLPSTLADRSVPIELRRRRVDEIIEPFRFDRTEPLDQLASQAARWALDNATRVRGTEPTIPTGVVNRTADNWRPLLAISDIAGGDWPTRTRHAVQCFMTTGDDELSTGVALLNDIRTIFLQRDVDRLRSAELVDALVAIEGRPWAEWKAGRPITPNSLARILAPWTTYRANDAETTSFRPELRHCTPVSVTRCGYSLQFGRASAPTIPQLVHTILGINEGTVRAPGRWSTFMVLSWWHRWHLNASDRTRLSRICAMAIGSIGSSKWMVAIINSGA
jgi:Protein of unknown function (DUF3631)